MCGHYPAGPDSNEVPRRRCTGLVRDNQKDLGCGTGRPGEIHRAVTRDSIGEKPLVSYRQCSKNSWLALAEQCGYADLQYAASAVMYGDWIEPAENGAWRIGDAEKAMSRLLEFDGALRQRRDQKDPLEGRITSKGERGCCDRGKARRVYGMADRNVRGRKNDNLFPLGKMAPRAPSTRRTA